MKRIKCICILSLLLSSTPFVFAQQATNSLERIIIEKALDIFEMYKSCITIADDETKSYFLDLFVDDSVQVYNDMLGVSTEKTIIISDYINAQKNNVISPIIRICNVKRENIWEENGKLKIQLSFDKSLSFQNQCGIHFNTQDFYGKMFRESMVLIYDSEQQVCRIESITGRIDSNRVLPDDYCILDSTNVKDSKVIYKHRDGRREQIKFNSFGQMLLTSGFDKDQFVYGDKDVVVKSNYKPECHLMTFSFKSYHWRIKPYYEIGISKALSLTNESFYSSNKSKSSSLGFDVGYVFSSKGHFKFGLFLGVGYSNTSLDLEYQNELYKISTDQDVDGDTYNRFYANLKINQSTTFKELSFPAYADIDWRFSPWISLYLNLGLKLNINLSESIDFTGFASNVYGKYPQYNNMYLDYHWGGNGFMKSLSLSKDNFCESERVSITKYVPDLLFGMGFRVNIPSTPLALDLGIGYQAGLNDIFIVSENTKTGKYDGNIVYNELIDNKNVEHVHDLLESTNNVSRKYWKFNIGLLFKF